MLGARHDGRNLRVGMIIFWAMLHLNCQRAILPVNQGLPRHRVTAVILFKNRWRRE
jgi:hypothetical protein